MRLERFRVPKGKMHHQGEDAPDKQVAKKKGNEQTGTLPPKKIQRVCY